jgi:SulP family sulfate permease
MLKPKIITTLRDYSWEKFRADVLAGIIVGIVAIPLAIAFGIASGVSPERGLFTAIIGGFIVSLLGGSRVQIAGPTGAFIVVVYGVVQKFGLEGLFLATIMGGVLLVVMGLSGLGAAIKFIPYPVIVGFTSGIALIIFSSQVKDFLGLDVSNVPAEFIDKWELYLTHLNTVNFDAVLISVLSLFIIVFWKKITDKLPGTLIALLVSTFLVHYFHLSVETIGSRFGEIPHHFLKPSLPHISMEAIRQLSGPAITIALLAGIESLLSAVVADGIIGGKHRSNMELVAQGIANIVSPIMGGIPVTGAIARTVTNINNGGKTPVSGIIHAVFLLLVMLFLGKWVVLIPLPCLAAVLVVVAYNMSEWKSFVMILRSPRSDILILLVTFFLTVIVDLTVAIQVGVVLASFLFMRRMSMESHVDVVSSEFKDEEEKDDPDAISKKDVPEGVEVYEVNGPFFFGASYKFMEAMKETKKLPKIRIIRMRNVPMIDATGLHVLERQFKNSKRRGVKFILSGVLPQSQTHAALKRSNLMREIAPENILPDIDAALNRAREILNEQHDHRPLFSENK